MAQYTVLSTSYSTPVGPSEKGEKMREIRVRFNDDSMVEDWVAHTQLMLPVREPGEPEQSVWFNNTAVTRNPDGWKVHFSFTREDQTRTYSSVNAAARAILELKHNDEGR
jgi:hypothetical protein